MGKSNQYHQDHWHLFYFLCWPFKKICFICIYVHTCIHVQISTKAWRHSSKQLWAWCDGLNMNSGLLQEQHPLLPADPSLQPLFWSFWDRVALNSGSLPASWVPILQGWAWMLGLNRRRGTEKVGGVLLGMQKPRLNPWTPQLDMMSHTCNPREKIIKLRSFLTKEHVLGQTGLQEMLSLIKTNKQANKQRSKVGWRGNSAVGSACSSYKRGPTSGAHNYLYLWF